MIIIFHISAVEHQQATFTIAGIFSFYYACQIALEICKYILIKKLSS